MRHVLAAAFYKFNNCHPEAAESHAQASDSQRRTSVLSGRKKTKSGCPISRVLCEKWDAVR